MTKEEFLAIAAEKYEKLQHLTKIASFYDYEKEFDQIWTEFGRQALEKNIGDLPLNPQKKTLSEPVTER
jgi:uncharacterized membrane protein